MEEVSIRLLKDHWLGELGCRTGDLTISKTIVSTHGSSLVGYPGVLAFKSDSGCVVSVPSQLRSELEMSFNGVSVEEAFNTEFLTHVFGGDVDRMIGPAWIGSIRKNNFVPCHSEETKLLAQSDWKVFDRFLSKNSQNDIEVSSLESGRSPTVALFQNGEIVAAAGYEVIGDKVAHIGVLSHPEFRGRGFASKVVSHITELALAENLGIQYQTLVQNVASVAAARRLGFEKFAETISVRLKSLKQ